MKNVENYSKERQLRINFDKNIKETFFSEKQKSDKNG